MSYEFIHRVSTPTSTTTRHANGDRVRHYGTKAWGNVLRSIPQSDGGYEYEIQRDDGTTGWWANYHIDRCEGQIERQTSMSEGNCDG